MIDILSLTAIVLIVVVICLIQHSDYRKDRSEWAEERKQLLDRLSARNLTEYARIRGDIPPHEPMETAHDRAIREWRHPNAPNAEEKKE